MPDKEEVTKDLLLALEDLIKQLELVGIAIEDEDEGQWRGTEGLSFSRAYRILKEAKQLCKLNEN